MASGLAQFESPFGNPSTAFDQGESTGMSVMDKAQQMRIAQDNQDYIDQQRQKLQPVIDAKNQADLATENASIQNMAQAQVNRAQIAKDSPQALQEWHDIQQIQDPGQRAAAAGTFAGKYAYFDQDPNNKWLPTAAREMQVQDSANAIAHNTLNQKVQESNANNARAVQVAQIAAGSRSDVAKIRESGLLQASTIKAGASMQDAVTRSNAPTDMMKNVQAMSQAAAAGDNATAEVYEDFMKAKSGLAPPAIAGDYIKMADSESKVASGLPQDSDEYAQHMRNSVNLMRRAQMILQPPAPSQAQPGNPAPAQPGGSVPDQQPSSTSPPPAAPAGKLYSVDPKTQRVMFSPSIKTPDDQLNAVQQMLKDRVITPQRARATLLSLGFVQNKPAEQAPTEGDQP